MKRLHEARPSGLSWRRLWWALNLLLFGPIPTTNAWLLLPLWQKVKNPINNKGLLFRAPIPSPSQLPTAAPTATKQVPTFLQTPKQRRRRRLLQAKDNVSSINGSKETLIGSSSIPIHSKMLIRTQQRPNDAQGPPPSAARTTSPTVAPSSIPIYKRPFPLLFGRRPRRRPWRRNSTEQTGAAEHEQCSNDNVTAAPKQHNPMESLRILQTGKPKQQSATFFSLSRSNQQRRRFALNATPPSDFSSHGKNESFSVVQRSSTISLCRSSSSSSSSSKTETATTSATAAAATTTSSTSNPKDELSISSNSEDDDDYKADQPPSNHVAATNLSTVAALSLLQNLLASVNATLEMTAGPSTTAASSLIISFIIRSSTNSTTHPPPLLPHSNGAAAAAASSSSTQRQQQQGKDISIRISSNTTTTTSTLPKRNGKTSAAASRNGWTAPSSTKRRLLPNLPFVTSYKPVFSTFPSHRRQQPLVGMASAYHLNSTRPSINNNFRALLRPPPPQAMDTLGARLEAAAMAEEHRRQQKRKEEEQEPPAKPPERLSSSSSKMNLHVPPPPPDRPKARDDVKEPPTKEELERAIQQRIKSSEAYWRDKIARDKEQESNGAKKSESTMDSTMKKNKVSVHQQLLDQDAIDRHRQDPVLRGLKELNSPLPKLRTGVQPQIAPNRSSVVRHQWTNLLGYDPFPNTTQQPPPNIDDANNVDHSWDREEVASLRKGSRLRVEADANATAESIQQTALQIKNMRNQTERALMWGVDTSRLAP